MNANKAEIVSVLRSRGLDARAAWVDRELPDVVDTDKNHSLLESTLAIDVTTLSPVDGDVELV